MPNTTVVPRKKLEMQRAQICGNSEILETSPSASSWRTVGCNFVHICTGPWPIQLHQGRESKPGKFQSSLSGLKEMGEVWGNSVMTTRPFLLPILSTLPPAASPVLAQPCTVWQHCRQASWKSNSTASIKHKIVSNIQSKGKQTNKPATFVVT